jgi:hypothetical protein
MRLTIMTGLLTLSACSCASIRHSVPPCDGMRTIDRFADPCGYADAIGACYGVPEPERARIRSRCESEIDRADPRLNATPPDGAKIEAQPK